MTAIYALRIFDNYVAYTDVGEGRKLGAEALKILQIACYLLQFSPCSQKF